MIEFQFHRLRTLRESHGLTLDEMAGRLGKQKQQLSLWENGINAPSMDNFVLICNTLDVDPSFFFSEASSSVEEAHAVNG